MRYIPKPSVRAGVAVGVGGAEEPITFIGEVYACAAMVGEGDGDRDVLAGGADVEVVCYRRQWRFPLLAAPPLRSDWGIGM